MRRGRGARWGLLLWAAGLAVGLAALHVVGSGSLGVPLGSAEGFSEWVDRAPPAVMAAALVRLAALATGWYLAACMLLLAITPSQGCRRWAATMARVSPAFVRRIATGAGSMGLAAGTLVAGVPAASTVGALGAPTAASADPAQEPPGRAPTATMTRSDPPTATMRRGDVAATTTTSPEPPDRPAGTPESPAAPPAAAAPVEPSSWIVEPGDSFWSIAAETVAERGEVSASDRRVARYWRRLIEANRQRLVDPANPDLLVPGQELIVPT
ncbi:MAG TPA: LysM peptidoglycan-binding domain-containing protein [Acidimicrobiales bacterium]|nr:LysM peptidoglycan-binding domain-containing protein [Acidimicrobiales bacterium]